MGFQLTDARSAVSTETAAPATVKTDGLILLPTRFCGGALLRNCYRSDPPPSAGRLARGCAFFYFMQLFLSIPALWDSPHPNELELYQP